MDCIVCGLRTESHAVSFSERPEACRRVGIFSGHCSAVGVYPSGASGSERAFIIDENMSGDNWR